MLRNTVKVRRPGDEDRLPIPSDDTALHFIGDSRVATTTLPMSHKRTILIQGITEQALCLGGNISHELRCTFLKDGSCVCRFEFKNVLLMQPFILLQVLQEIFG